MQMLLSIVKECEEEREKQVEFVSARYKVTPETFGKIQEILKNRKESGHKTKRFMGEIVDDAIALLYKKEIE